MTDLAKRIVLRHGPHTYRLEIDGQPFPWHIAADGITVTIDKDGVPGVTLTIVAEAVDVQHALSDDDLS